MPNRIIKESIRESYDINKLSPNAEVLFYRLITYADDYGLFKADPLIINKILFPLKSYNDKDIIVWMNEISETQIIFYYIGEDKKPYGKFVNWEKHQTIRNIKSKYPQPNGDKFYNISNLMTSFSNNCNQLQSIESKCISNPIQSNTIIIQSESETAEKRVSQIDKMDGFDEFYKLYPKHKAIQDAKKAWISPKNKCSEIKDTIYNAVQNQLDNNQFDFKDNMKFIKLPATWLNQHCWNDEIIKVHKPHYTDEYKPSATQQLKPYSSPYTSEMICIKCEYRQTVGSKVKSCAICGGELKEV